MTLNFYKSESNVKPELLDTTSSKKVVYIRQNVVELEKTDENTGETYTYYEYEEAKLTKEEYEKYKEELSNAKTLESVEILKAENEALTEQVNMLTECILEMSMMLYV